VDGGRREPLGQEAEHRGQVKHQRFPAIDDTQTLIEI
jgi:hypothetical protein